MYYASDELRVDREVVMLAVAQDGGVLDDASDELKADREVQFSFDGIYSNSL